jgi:hypothetical protein
MAGFFNGGFMMTADLVTLGAAEKPFGPRVVIRKWLISAAIAVAIWVLVIWTAIAAIVAHI